MENQNEHSAPCIQHTKWKGDCIWCWVESYRVLEAELQAARGAIEEERKYTRGLLDQRDSVHKMFDTEHEKLLRVEKKNKQLHAEIERLKKQLKISEEARDMLANLRAETARKQD